MYKNKRFDILTNGHYKGEKMVTEKNYYENFKGEKWKQEINVADFIACNYKEYKGDDSFLAQISKKTSKVWAKCEKLLANRQTIKTYCKSIWWCAYG